MGPDRVTQGILIITLLYFIYITISCPCRKLLSCHMTETKYILTIILSIVLYENLIKP